jgi:hypothetical protein
VYKKNEQYEVFDKLIITTGGQAYRHTGSTGDGYSFAEDLGHSITELGPSLNSFILKEDFFAEISGLSLKSIRLSAKCKDGKKHKFTGPALFTHKGLTGPVVFALSAWLAFSEISRLSPIVLYIDLITDKDLNELECEWLSFLKKSPKKHFKHFLYSLLPKSLVDLLDVNYDLKNNFPSDSLNIKTVRLLVVVKVMSL